MGIPETMACEIQMSTLYHVLILHTKYHVLFTTCHIKILIALMWSFVPPMSASESCSRTHSGPRRLKHGKKHREKPQFGTGMSVSRK